MKAKLCLTGLLSFVFYLLSSQAPNGFNYQAIARNSTGKEITNTTLQVQISILSDTTGFYGTGAGTYIWEEQQNVTTNSFGLFTLVLGSPAATKIQGSAASFSAIDWKSNQLFIGTKINYLGTWRFLGSAKIWSVPYSMVAGSLSGPYTGNVTGNLTGNVTGNATTATRLSPGTAINGVTFDGSAPITVPAAAGTLTGTTLNSSVTSSSLTSVGTLGSLGVTGTVSAGGFIGPFTGNVTGNAATATKLSPGNSINGVNFDGSALITVPAAAGTLTGTTLNSSVTSSSLTSVGTLGLLGVTGTVTAGGFVGPFQKLAVKSNVLSPDSALFEVKNSKGQTVFAVYSEGVRIYVDDGVTKGATKGGFAIGGFGTVKGPSQEYFRVTKDSTRVYLNDTGVKNTKGGFAIGGFDQAKGSKQDFLTVSTDSIRIYINNNQVKGAAKGGFAIGGFDQVKAGKEEYLRVTRDSTRIYVNNPAKGNTKGGFAIGGFDQAKGTITPFTSLTPENSFIGHESGMSNTTGLYNSFFGYKAGRSNTVGNYNVLIGNQAGEFNTEGGYNTFIGFMTGNLNTIGVENVFMGFLSGERNNEGSKNVIIGSQAGDQNTSGSENVFIGSQSGFENTTGEANVFIGNSSGYTNSLGSENVFLGENAGYFNTVGEKNVFLGSSSGYRNTEGNENVFLGSYSGEQNTTGFRNIFLGSLSGEDNTTGWQNIAIGTEAGRSLKTGVKNIFIGTSAGTSNTGGENNVFIGNYAGSQSLGSSNVYIGRRSAELNTSGINNVFLGEQSGRDNLTGTGNVFIGNQAGSTDMGSNKLIISNSATTSPLIYGEFDNNKLVVNGSVNVKELLNLKPQTASPGNPAEGDVFYDANSHSIKYFNGTSWMALSATASASTPSVTTVSVPSQTLLAVSCSVNSNISNQGGSAIIQSGILYSNAPFFNKESATQINYSTPGVGSYTITLTGLSVSTNYYVRSFATNSQGTSLGNMISFTTPLLAALPTVETNSISSITQTTAIGGGNVTAPGGTVVTARGVCWGTSSNPTIANNFTTNGSGAGAYTSNLSGLTANTTYYVRAYATNSNGTTYGNEVIFASVTTFTDIDGNIYNAIQIGNQTWMKENLKTTKYSNGNTIPNISDNTAWSAQTTGAYCWYNNSITNKNPYGALYNFYTVADNRNLCPAGWHVPTDEEWAILTTFLGGTGIAGGKLKETGTAHWTTPNTGADNSSGFTALGGGYREGGTSLFAHFGTYGDWWSASESDETNASDWGIDYQKTGVYSGPCDKKDGYSVRCLRDL
jgi:uncharacterized protein (TIGR02145 family)